LLNKDNKLIEKIMAKPYADGDKVGGNTNSKEDELSQSRVFTERGINERLVSEPDSDTGLTQEAESISEQASIGREASGSTYPESKEGDKNPMHGQGFGLGTQGGLEAERNAKSKIKEHIGQRPLDSGNDEKNSLGL
jgi:hypothetical protein